MNSKENQFEKIIKSQMENYEVVPEEDFWNTIELTIVRKQRIRNLVKGVSISFIVILISVFAYRKITSAASIKSEPVNETIIESSSSVSGDQTHKETESKPQMNHAEDQKNSKNGGENSLLKEQVTTTSTTASDSVSNALTTQQTINNKSFTGSSDTIHSSNTKAAVPENVIPKKVVKKPVYIIQQDTIYKVDTLKVKKKKIK